MFTGGYSELTRNWTSNPVWGAKMGKENRCIYTNLLVKSLLSKGVIKESIAKVIA